MDKVRTPEQLIAPHRDLLHTLQQALSVPEKEWNDLYMPLITEVAEFWQQLQTRDGEPLLHAALSRGVETQRRLSAEKPASVAAIRRCNCFAAALLYDVGLPMSELEVNVETRSGMVRWNPLTNSRIAELGQIYDQTWSTATPQSRHLYPIIAYSLLPHRVRQLFGSNPRELNLLVRTLQGGHNNPMAKYVNPTAQPTDIRNPPPKQKIQPFINYLQHQLDTHRVNRDESVLHTTEEGLFVQNPNVFQDFNVSYWQETRIALVASGATLPPPKGRFWKLCISRSTGPKIIDGFVIDLKAANLSAPPATGKARIQRG